jgi:hypothetical protein
MSTGLLTALVVVPTAAVVVAFFWMMWRERTSQRGAVVAIIAGLALAAWAVMTAVFGASGKYLQSDDGGRIPPIGVQLFGFHAGDGTVPGVFPHSARTAP